MNSGHEPSSYLSPSTPNTVPGTRGCLISVGDMVTGKGASGVPSWNTFLMNEGENRELSNSTHFTDARWTAEARLAAGWALRFQTRRDSGSEGCEETATCVRGAATP